MQSRRKAVESINESAAKEKASSDPAEKEGAALKKEESKTHHAQLNKEEEHLHSQEATRMAELYTTATAATTAPLTAPEVFKTTAIDATTYK